MRGDPLQAFQKLQEDGELHKDSLKWALQLCGYLQASDNMITEVLTPLTKYSTLELGEFLEFVSRFDEALHKHYHKYFDSHASSGTIDVAELTKVLASLGIHPLRGTLMEIIAEVDDDGSGEVHFQEFVKIIELLSSREGFTKRYLNELLKLFKRFDFDHSGEIETSELSGALNWIGLTRPPDVVEAALLSVDADGSGSLNEKEFISCLRLIRDGVIEQVRQDAAAHYYDGSCTISGIELESLLKHLGFDPRPLVIRDALEDAGFNDDSELDLSDLWDFLKIFRWREGFSRDEMRHLEEAFVRYCPAGTSPRPASGACPPLAFNPPEGEISTLAAGRALRWLGYVSPFQVRLKLVAEVDVDHSKAVNFSEFLKLARRFREREQRDAAIIFKRFDAAEIGFLADPPTSGPGLSPQRRALRAMGCEDEDGRPPERTPEEEAGVDFHGFLNIVLRTRAAARERWRANSGFLDAEVAKLRPIFRKYDRNRNNTIDQTEIRTLVEEALPEFCTFQRQPELKRIIAAADINSDGVLDFGDFLRLMRRAHDFREEEMLDKEIAAANRAGFKRTEVEEFRELFLDQDFRRLGVLPFDLVARLVGRSLPLGAKNSEFLERVFDEVVEPAVGGADFSDFLWIMRRILDSGLFRRASV